MLTEEQGKFLLALARKNIASYLSEGHKLKIENGESQDWLKENGAVFVTLQLDGALRGCIGSLTAYRSLNDDLISHSYNAAFEDPRFPPLAIEEFESVKIEVSVLSKRKPVDYVDYDDLKLLIKPFHDGVYLIHGAHSATFLPQVWEQLPDFDLFFRHLCLKAGLLPEVMKTAHPQIEKYSVQKFKEI